MFPRTVLLLCLLACSAAASAYRLAEPEFQTNRFKRSDFIDTVQDWFRNIRERMFGSLFRTERTRQQEQLDTFQLETADNPDRFFVDVSTLNFDPQQDWGFRIGNWYLIRKGNVNSEESGNPRVETPQFVTDSWKDVTESERGQTKTTTEFEGSKEPFGETVTQKESPEVFATTASSPKVETTESSRTEFGPKVTEENLSSESTESGLEISTEPLRRETTEFDHTELARTEIAETEGKISVESGEIQTEATVPILRTTTTMESGPEESLESVEEKIVTDGLRTASTMKSIASRPDDSVNDIKEKKHFTADSKPSAKKEPSSVEVIGP